MKFALFILASWPQGGPQEQSRVQYFGASMSFGSLAQKKELRSMELFAQEVMPKFR